MRLVALSLMLSSYAYAKPTQNVLDNIKRAADKVGVPHKVLYAICKAESHLNPKALGINDGGNNSHAYGLCQIRMPTAKWMGFKGDDNCINGDFSNKSNRIYRNCKLFGPYTNAYWAAKYIKYQLDRYDNSWINAIAAYNAGSVRTCTTGYVTWKKTGEKLHECQIGGLLNQVYVDRVLFHMRDFDESGK